MPVSPPRAARPQSAAHRRPPPPAQADTDSDMDVYGQKYAPSNESLGPPRLGISESSTPTFIESGSREPYPAWNAERQIPLSKEEIEDIFLDLTQKFGFQRDSMRNMVRCGSGWPSLRMTFLTHKPIFAV